MKTIIVNFAAAVALASLAILGGLGAASAADKIISPTYHLDGIAAV